METTEVTRIIKTISKAEVDAFVASHMTSLKAADVVLHQGQGPNSWTKAIGLGWGVDRATLDPLLRSQIADLPAMGKYSFQVMPDGSMRVSFEKPPEPAPVAAAPVVAPAATVASAGTLVAPGTVASVGTAG